MCDDCPDFDCGSTPVLCGVREASSTCDSSCNSGSHSSKCRSKSSCSDSSSSKSSCSDSSRSSSSTSSCRKKCGPKVKGMELTSCSDTCGGQDLMFDCSGSSGSESCHPGARPPYYPRGRYNPGDEAFGFRALICPLKDLAPCASACNGTIQFWMRRKNCVVTLQWEGFRGRLGATGVAYLAVNQTICNLPPADMTFPIRVILRGKPRIAYLQVSGFCNPSPDQIRFYLSVNGVCDHSCENDCVEIPGTAVSWITM